MARINQKQLVLIVVGLTLVVLLGAESKKVIEDDTDEVTRHRDQDELKVKFSKREAVDGAEEDKPKSKKHKKKVSSSTTVAPAADDGSSTTAPTTTGSPSDSKAARSTTKKATSKPDFDQRRVEKLVKDHDDEKALLQKAEQAYRDWIAWLDSHDKKSLNRYRAAAFTSLAIRTHRLYLGSAKKPIRNRGYSYVAV